MELTFRAASPAERLYSGSQSMQLKCQTGCVGHLRAGTGIDTQGFLKAWQSHRQDLDAREFQTELESVLNTLESDGQYGGFLKSLDAMRTFCREHPESGFNDGSAFGFRADTAQYSYLIRLSPYREKENLALYCYRRDWLDRHMKQAEKGIRFITPDYREKFRIEDGDMVRISCPDGSVLDRECRYIDDCHVEVGRGWDSLYHICQLAEKMERSGSTVIPLRSSLPLICYGRVPGVQAAVMFERGFDGFCSTVGVPSGSTAQKLADQLNSEMGVTRAQAAAMRAGALEGWAAPTADPKNYDEQGRFVRPGRPDRGDAR